MNKAVVLLSGGLDSSTLLHYVKVRLGVPEVYALSFMYGQKHSREMEAARWQAHAAGVADHREIDLSLFSALAGGGSALTDAAQDIPDLKNLPESVLQQPPTYVPHRNLVLLSLAAACAEAVGAQDVFYGAQAQDCYGYWDCTVDFVSRINHLLALNRGRPVTVRAPFAGWGKGEVLRVGLELGVEYAHTWTCYRGAAQPCGSCPSCVERAGAFRAAGVPDPLAAN